MEFVRIENLPSPRLFSQSVFASDAVGDFFPATGDPTDRDGPLDACKLLGSEQSREKI